MAKYSWLEPLEQDIHRLAHKEGDAATAIMKLRGGERRNVAILFLDIKGFTAMSEKLDSEVVQLIIDHCFKVFSADIVDFGGYIEKYMGDAIMACFGAVASHENDAERAIRAGVRVLEKLESINNTIGKLGLKIGVRIGVNYGLVTTGRVGLGRERDFTVMGDTVNTAQRLESNAPVNSLMIRQELAEDLGELFIYKNLEPVKVKGKEEPLQVCNVIGLGSKRTERWNRSLLTGHAEFLGRNEEMAQLVDLYQKSRDIERPVPCLARITAPAGSGKSRLIHEYLNNHIPPDFGIHLHGNTVNYITTPYELFNDLVKRALDLDSEDPEVFLKTLTDFATAEGNVINPNLIKAAPFLASMLEIPLEEDMVEAMDPKARQLEIQLALSEFFKTAVSLNDIQYRKRAPLVVVLDDLHWIDPSSLTALNFIINQLSKTPRLIWICITRPETSLPESFDIEQLNVALEPFNVETLSEMIGSMLPGVSFSEQDLQLLHQKTTGLPYFIEEMINTFVKAGVVEKKNDQWILAKPLDATKMPDSLNGLIKTRIDQMDERSREILSQGSVVGTDFDRGSLDYINEFLEKDVEDIPEKIKEISSNDLIITAPEKQYSFKNLVIQEVAYESLLLRNRSLLHRLVAEYLENNDIDELRQAPLLFHHYSKTNQYDKLFHYLDLALQIANKNYDLQTGLTMCDTGIKLLDEMEEGEQNAERRQQILAKRIYINNLLGNREIQEADVNWCLEYSRNVGNPDIRALSLTDQAELYERTSRFQEGLDALKLLDSDINNIGDKYKLRYHRRKGILFERTGKYDEALMSSNIALQLAKDNKWTIDVCGLLINIGLLQSNRGNYDEAVRNYEEALELNNTLNDRRNRGMILNNLGIVRKSRGEYSSALENYKEVFEIFETIGERNFMAFSLGNMGITQNLLGQFQESINTMELANDYFKQINNPMGDAMSRQILGAVFIEIGEPGLAREHLDEALEIGEKTGYKPLIIDVNKLMARLLHDIHESDKALEMADKALAIAEEIKKEDSILTLLAIKVNILIDLNRSNEASQAVTNLTELLEKLGKVEEEAFIHFVLHRYFKSQLDDQAMPALEKSRQCIQDIADALSDTDKDRFLSKPLNQKILA